MLAIDASRRSMLVRALSLGAFAPGAKLLAATCAVAGAPDSAMRTELHYVESGPEQNKRCAQCTFFSDLKGACGTCQILNGPANADGHCDSWAVRG